LLYDINGLAKEAPGWVDRVMEFVGEYGILLGLAVVLVGCWWTLRRREDAPAAMASLLWAPLAAGIALLINIPIRGFVERPRPFLDHQGLEVLVQGKADYSFVSDHTTMAMAIGVGLFITHRRFGLIGIGLALLEGLCRVYMGVHYPTDVIGGFALGTAVTLLLAPLAQALLTPLTTAVARSPRIGRLVRAKGPGRPVESSEGAAWGLPGASRPDEAEDKHLAA
jgi:undecaprenyl-diphosphatase